MKSKRSKILIITDGYPTKRNSLTGVFVKEQVDEIKKKKEDWDIHVYYNPFFSIFSNTLNKRSLFWNAIKWSMQIICFIPLLFKKYDLIHAHRFFLPVINGIMYKAIHKTPLIVTSHGIIQIQKRYDKKWTKRVFKNCDKIITVNDRMKDDFISNFDLNEKDITVRSCGINFSLFDKVSMSVTNKKRSEYILGFVGDYSNNKRPYLFLKCVQALKEKYNISGVMIGGGEMQKEVQNYIKQEKLPVTVQGTLEHNELLSYYNEFDLLVFPSASETFGIVGIEALYCQVPVISSDVGGKSDYIKHEVNGMLFEKDNLYDLIDKISKVLDNKDLFIKMKNNARNSVKNYSHDLVADTVIKIYQEFI